MASPKTKATLIGGAIAAVTLTGALFLTSSSDINVPVGGNVQQAINDAPCGATIVLESGQAYTASLTLPNKDCGDQWITIRSSRAAELPEGQRVNPSSQSALLARLQTAVPAEPVVKTVAGAHHYRFIGVEMMTRDANAVVYDLVRFGGGRDEQKTLASVPHHLVIDRSYIHGWSTQDVQRGVTLNSAYTDITNSYISDIHGEGYDTQAIGGWNGPGPFRVINNYVEGAGENIMFGGADPGIQNLIPSDIEIRRNYVFKPLSWKVGHPTYAGKHWTVKNLLELKNARNVTIDGNKFENNWTDGQAGVAILFTVRNQECTAPWSTVQNVTWSNNIVKGADGGAFNFLGKDNEAELAYGKCKDPAKAGSVRGSGFTATNNLVYDIGGSFLTLNGFENVSFTRTTHTQRWNFTTIYGQPSPNFHYMNNLMVDHEYGMYIEAGSGTKGLDILTPGWRLEQNVIIGATDPGSWPPNNQLVNGVTLPPDFRSPYPSAGCDIDALLAAQAGGGVVSQPSPQPSPSATVTVSPSPTPTAQQTSANNTRVPPASQIVAADGAVWTLSGSLMLRNGADSGGRGPELLWCSQAVYALGTDSVYWRWDSGTSWTRVVADPCALATPTPTATSTPTPSPSPTSTPTPTPSPQPTATVAPTPSRICARGERPGVPPQCMCRNNAPVRPNGKCP